jgi:CHAT domain-containing protein
VFLSNQTGFRGAIIIGLGKPENLTAPELTKSVEQGVSNYILHLNDEPDQIKPTDGENKTVGLSSLIIGSGYGGLSVENSIKAIIQGVHNANIKVKNLNLGNTKTVGKIEFVELFEDSAVGALYSLSRIEIQETRSFKVVMEEKKLHTLLGSRKRIPNEISTDWWNRITVKKVETSDTDKSIRCLAFSASTSHAHEKENELLSTPSLMEGTIKEMSTSNRWTPQSAKAIFELLIPNDFKEQLKRHGNINWILDHYTAEYPWELLQDEITDARPLCVASGMIRQLSTKNYRRVIKSAPKNNALVIADPDLKGFASQLPGALKEGQKVSEMLSARGINTTTCFKGSSGEIIEKLFCNDYRIIHLSGHGIFNQDQSKGSGMVIGKDMYLSTREINQMSTVPELVFVNCCHIGKISGMAEELYQQRYKLAANIGTQLIENGVRCVIAAGWAVDDNAALEFANVFYDRMFGGYTFGDSVKEARRLVLEKYSNTNTWGAYQCYGDPFFRFEHMQREYKRKKIEYLIAQEAEVDLENLLSELQIGKKSTDEYMALLEDISKGVDKAKIRTHSITEKEALIYFELKEYDKTCEKLGSLLNKEDATFSFSVAEKYYNAMAKKITNDFKGILGKKNENLKIIEKERKISLSKIVKVIKDLEALVKLIPSSERFNILGSTYKRNAFMLETDKQEVYKKAALNYQKAYFFSTNWYSLTNWLALESTLVMAGSHSWGSNEDNNKNILEYKLPSTDEALRLLEASRELHCVNTERMSYWDMLAGINIGLCKYILLYSDKSDKKEFENIYKEISELWKKAGSKGKRFAEIEHLEFVIDAFSGTQNINAIELKSKLEQLLKDLSKQL